MEDRLGYWLDVVRDLLAEPLTELPLPMILNELVATFGAQGGSWVDRHASGHINYQLLAGMRVDQETVAWMRSRLDQHPLLCWFSVTGDPSAQTIARVPGPLIDPRYAEWAGVIGGLDVEHQMAIPLTLQGVRHRAFVIVTGGEDFTERDVLLARRLQALLIGLDRQAGALARWMPRKPCGEAGLTARELAVLSLMANGLTAQAAARRLLISPRTVQKHVEHIYAKLRVSDRVSAVCRAQSLGLVGR
ncbi:helix-turn-helix transcriptional regulator [Lentzea californiensis]|uniref:helix-turn-helix transcriptional regulator n=1 Tax=Lentzea californiensis TaxID=438851 RepID=UPI0021653BE9|nr:LuxR C-terminal-related transcriptional regulator [Lentzea californiensis]MCR3752252.1 regulatory protein, luxR family [Lentzea californiensis]